MPHLRIWYPVLLGFVAVSAVACSPETAPAPTTNSGADEPADQVQVEPPKPAPEPEPEPPKPEPKTEFTKADTFMATTKGARVTLRYDESTKYFRGFVENMMRDDMEQAHVTVTLSSGEKLGPKTVRSIEAGSSEAVDFAAGDADFETFKVETIVGPLDGASEGAEEGFGEIGDIGDPEAEN